MEIFERASIKGTSTSPSPPAAQRAPVPEEGIKRANVGAWVHASLLYKQTLYPGREIDLTNPSLPQLHSQTIHTVIQPLFSLPSTFLISIH